MELLADLRKQPWVGVEVGFRSALHPALPRLPQLRKPLVTANVRIPDEQADKNMSGTKTT